MAAQPEEAVARSNPSQAKFECSDSHHSDSGRGANNDDGYQSTCDPDDFGGNGQESGPGKQTGKPCAGCVGNADDKNPPGQFPDGSDANSGYECDGRDRPFENQDGNGNHGIGDENPAHTGCTSSTEPADTPNPTCPNGSPMTDTDGNGVVDAADCNPAGNGDDDTSDPTCPNGSPMTDTDGNGIVNAADCNPAGNDDDTPDPEVIANTGSPVVQGQSEQQAQTAVQVRLTEPAVLASAVSATVPVAKPKGAEVLGVHIERGPAVLAATGVPSVPYVGIGSMLVLLGSLLTYLSRNRARA